VFDNVALPLRVAGMREREAGRRVRAALSAVSLLEKERLFPVHLSTGEQQRVGIARAVVNRPRILLADEPTGNLDPDLSRDIMDLFRQFHQVGTTVIIASHDQALIESMGVRIVVLSHGKLGSVDGDA
jgi:cell division transport system ATP-binding protein